MNHSSYILAVIFDMDGVIADTMVYHMRAWRMIFARYGIHVSKNDIYKREGQKGINSVEEIFKEYNRPFDLTGGHRILLEKEELFKRIVKKRFIPGSRQFVKMLKKRGFKLSLVTGTARHEVHKILPDEIFNLFDVVVCGTDVQNGKPHPEPYLTALKKLSIDSHEAIVIENAPFGIRSAKAAGLRCLALETSLPKAFLKEADGIFHSFAHLKSKTNFHLNTHER
jgi:beta-phosphoglucomutase